MIIADLSTIMTVGDLRQMVAMLDKNGIKDTTPIARCAGATFAEGIEVKLRSLTTYGGNNADVGTITLRAEDDGMKNWKGTKKTFDALSFE